MRYPALLLIIALLAIPPFSFGETLDVSANVPSTSQNLHTSLASNPSSSTQLSKNQDITFTQEYNTNLAYSTELTVEASWSRGIEDNSTVITYVPGSASNAYNSTPPIVDTTNRTIQWRIASFPANLANQTVTFTLRTSNTLESITPITFTVTSKTLDEDSGAYATQTKTFTYSSSATPTNTPTPTLTPTPTSTQTASSPTNTPTPTLTPTPTSTVKLLKPALTYFELATVTDKNATIRIGTTRITSGNIRYGTSPTSLLNTINLSNRVTNHVINLEDLTPNTTYYTQIQLTNAQGTTYSELFQFTTALKEEKILIDKSSVSLISGNLKLTEFIVKKENAVPTFYLPPSSPYQLHMFIENSSILKSLDVVVRNHSIQGVTTLSSYAVASELFQMVEISPGTYRGILKSPTSPQNYDIFIRGHDISGGITEEKVAELVIHPPFKVVKKATKEPLSEAKVKLLYKDPTTKKFVAINPQKIAIENPTYSNYEGIIPIVLPLGTYKAIISRVGYKTQEVYFTIGPGKSSGYPLVQMEQESISLFQIGSYLYDSSTDILSKVSNSLVSVFGNSRKAYHLTATLVMTIFLILLITSLASRFSKHIFHLPSHLAYLLTRHKGEKKKFSGIILDNVTDKPLSHASVYLKNDDGTVLSHAVTNFSGAFVFNSIPKNGSRLEVVKVGYLPSHFHINDFEHRTYAVTKKTPLGFRSSVIHLLTHFLSSSFELLLLLSFLSTLLIGISIGWNEVIPFAVISFLSFSVWTLHYHRK